METPFYFLALLLISFVSLACQFLAIMDPYNREKGELWGSNRWVWSVIILLGFIFGALVYLGAGRVSQKQESHLLKQGELT